jgi:hypothetical protein
MHSIQVSQRLTVVDSRVYQMKTCPATAAGLWRGLLIYVHSSKRVMMSAQYQTTFSLLYFCLYFAVSQLV